MRRLGRQLEHVLGWTLLWVNQRQADGTFRRIDLTTTWNRQDGEWYGQPSGGAG
ncbi:MAG: hypothetical protein KAY24_16405 [Candidatus Eisenbacteria sp.]|nr:hypothetical protein [Candidatus Eisenbacteria bacterium]